MFRKKNQQLDEAKTRIFVELAMYDPSDEEYEKLINRLNQLNQLETNKNRISPDTIAIVLGNLLGIIVIVAYEQKHVFASKASNFIMKVK